MWYLILFFITAGTLGTVIGYMVETSWSMTTETLIGAGVIFAGWAITQMARRVIRPCFAAIDEAVRDAEESAGR